MFVQKKTFISGFVLLLFISASVFSQNLPKKIRGYKVYQTKISIKTETDKTAGNKDAEAIVKIGEPEISDISLTGITLEIPAVIEGIEQKGRIDFVMFEDFKINDLKVEIEEYNESFEFNNAETVTLPKPIKMFISARQTLRGALKELKESKKDWKVSGRVFVFGTFKKFGIGFKRVVPLEINLIIENPVKKKISQNDNSN